MPINIARYWSLNKTSSSQFVQQLETMWGLENCFRKEQVNKSYFYIASVLNRVSSWRQFLGGQPYPESLSLWPESVSEVSDECEFPAHLIKINVMTELRSPTREICNSLSLSTQK